MPDALIAAALTPGLIWLILTIAVAGVVRGFSGFGTALVFVPVAGAFLAPADIITIMVLTGLLSTATLMPRAWKHADRTEVSWLAAASVVTVPLGIMALGILDPLAIRWFVAGMAGTTLVLMVLGWRYTGHIGRGGLLGLGAAAGLTGGMTGVSGPIIILFYLAGQARAQNVRANTILYLGVLDVVIGANLFLGGLGRPEAIWLAALLCLPYFVTSLIGQALFRPELERVYRSVTYIVIALAVASGLPVWQ